jgi:TetR/AcrR family transcriptional repressor of mexJK operon
MAEPRLHATKAKPGRKANAGRPKGTARTDKRQAILEAARAVFATVGYDQASMDAISAKARVSKATVYAHFGSKAALFGAIIRDNCERMLGSGSASVVSAESVEHGLRELGRRYVELILSENALATARLVAAESLRAPELARAFYEAGPALALETTRRYFAEQALSGQLTVADPALAAELFLAALRSDLHLRRLIGLPFAEADEAKAIERRVAETARAFAAAYRGRS